MATHDFCSVQTCAGASGACAAVQDEPGWADISLGSNPLHETEQMNNQEEPICLNNILL